MYVLCTTSTCALSQERRLKLFDYVEVPRGTSAVCPRNGCADRVRHDRSHIELLMKTLGMYRLGDGDTVSPSVTRHDETTCVLVQFLKKVVLESAYGRLTACGHLGLPASGRRCLSKLATAARPSAVSTTASYQFVLSLFAPKI